MLEAAVVAHAFVEGVLTRVTEGCVAEIVRQADGLGEGFIQRQRTRDGAADLRHLDRVGHPCPEQVTFVVDEHLSLVGQPAEGIGVNDAIAVALEFATVLRRRLVVATPAAARIIRGVHGQTDIVHPKCAASVSRNAASG